MSACYASMQQNSNCCSTSAAGTSMRLGRILDTVIVTVSIFIVWILGILLGERP